VYIFQSGRDEVEFVLVGGTPRSRRQYRHDHYPLYAWQTTQEGLSLNTYTQFIDLPEKDSNGKPLE
jgi:hypothetical protein